MFCHLPALTISVSVPILHPRALAKSLGVSFETTLNTSANSVLSTSKDIYNPPFPLGLPSSSQRRLLLGLPTSTQAPEQPFTAAGNIYQTSPLPLLSVHFISVSPEPRTMPGNILISDTLVKWIKSCSLAEVHKTLPEHPGIWEAWTDQVETRKE